MSAEALCSHLANHRPVAELRARLHTHLRLRTRDDDAHDMDSHSSNKLSTSSCMQPNTTLAWLHCRCLVPLAVYTLRCTHSPGHLRASTPPLGPSPPFDSTVPGSTAEGTGHVDHDHLWSREMEICMVLLRPQHLATPNPPSRSLLTSWQPSVTHLYHGLLV